LLKTLEIQQQDRFRCSYHQRHQFRLQPDFITKKGNNQLKKPLKFSSRLIDNEQPDQVTEQPILKKSSVKFNREIPQANYSKKDEFSNQAYHTIN